MALQLQMISHHIVAEYSGTGFTSFVGDRLFNVLNMTSTTYSPLKAEGSGRLSHSWAPDGRRIPFYNSDNMHHSQTGVDGVISNAVDMVRVYFNHPHIVIPLFSNC